MTETVHALPVAILTPLVVTTHRCRFCDQLLRYRPDPDPDDPETSDCWLGVDDTGCLDSVCFGAGAELIDCPVCDGSGAYDNGDECETCEGTKVIAEHRPAATGGENR